MKYNRMGKWGENSIAHWNEQDYAKAKEEIAKAKETDVAVKDTDVPDEVRLRIKAAKKQHVRESS